MRGRKARREEVYEGALRFFALNPSGHIYGVKSALSKSYYYSSVFQAVKSLEAEGLIYQIGEERAQEGKPPRKIYRLSCLGFVEALKRHALTIVKDAAFFNGDFVRSALETHQRLCPAIFPKLAREYDDQELCEVVKVIVKHGGRYFHDADLDSMSLMELDAIAPLVFCSILYDAAFTSPSLMLTLSDRAPIIERIFGRKLSLERDRPIKLTVGQVQDCFLAWYLMEMNKGESQLSWESRSDFWLKWIRKLNPQVEDPRRLLAIIMDLKQKFLEHELESIKRAKKTENEKH